VYDDPPPPEDLDPITRYYWDRIDVEELRANLKLTLEQRIQKMMRRLREEAAAKPSETIVEPDWHV
jgi:hypothetical protein